MKTTALLPLPKFTAFGGALLKGNNVCVGILCLVIVALWNTHSVTAAPAKLDSLDSTFPFNFQPPVLEATGSASSPANGPRHGSAITVDSYGNPIRSLQPIQTPDGRQVVSAQGLQFEIPNYASGITELTKPSDDLLPPFVDPIVVAQSNANSDAAAPAKPAKPATNIDVESVALVKLGEQPAVSHSSLSLPSKRLPEYILALNDPDIGGAVDYMPVEDKQSLNVITWDLLPPLEADVVHDKTFSHNSITTGHSLLAAASQESSQITQTPLSGLRRSIETAHSPNQQGNGDKSYYTSTTTPRTTTTRTTTTTTPRTTTTTTRRTTTPRTTTTTTRRPTTPRTTATTTTAPDSAEFFKLEAGDSYTLPAWLQDIDDPDLDVAVTFEIPEDINEYNHTVERDLVAPLEPYTDLKNINLTPPPSSHRDGTTTARTTTTTTTTTTTRRPTGPTAQLHWVRAKATTTKPTIATFNKQFTSLNPSITSSTNFAQRTTSATTATATTATTTTTTTVKPKSSITFYNRQLSSNTAQTDKIGSGSSSSSEEDNPRSTNPFLRKFDDGKYKPQQSAGRSSFATTTTNTTTTTTTTPVALSNEKNPFEATIPPWLKDFDYPDLGPGVPFVYDPNEDENPVDKNILPPAKTEDEPNPANPNSNPPFSNSQTPQGFTNKFSTSVLSLTSSSSIPSITTIPFPSAQKTTRPPRVFVAPTFNSPTEGNDDISIKTSTTFNKHFPAPFDTSAGSSDPKKIPLSAERESFPPFNNIITGSSTVPSKTTFSKSEDGKVITNNIFLNGGTGSSTTKPIGSSPAANPPDKSNSLTTQSSAGSSFTTSAGTSAFVTSLGSAASETSKYTGRFGGPPGVLAPQVNGFGAASTASTKSAVKSAVTAFGVTAVPSSSKADNKDKFTGSFGGPPGVLKPYDNVKKR